MLAAAQGATPAERMHRYAGGNLIAGRGAHSLITSVVPLAVQRQHVVIHPCADRPCRYVADTLRHTVTVCFVGASCLRPMR